MKRWLALFLAIGMTLSFAACSSANGEGAEVSHPPVSSTDSSQESERLEMEEAEISTVNGGEDNQSSDILVAYFSWADNAILEEDVDGVTSPSVIPPGNVQQLAAWVQEETGGDLFSIQVADPYPSNWDQCLERANEERSSHARPELVSQVENLEQYSTIFLGYPNWWYGVPMALLTFLEENDLSGKEVYLFCSHGTGGLARSVELITEAAPQANISSSIFDCFEEDAATSEENIKTWLEELGFASEQDGQQTQQNRQIAVQFDGGIVVYQLNDSAAADSLLSQLPLTIAVEDYRTNEKIFYPPQGLDTTNAPLAEGGAGALAYYAPWGDVVMFYNDFEANGALYELGKAVSGEEGIEEMAGTITIEHVK